MTCMIEVMTEKNKMPYIGMSGVVNTEQQAQLEAYVNDLGLYDASRKFAYCEVHLDVNTTRDYIDASATLLRNVAQIL